jgi:hypothetical protein
VAGVAPPLAVYARDPFKEEPMLLATLMFVVAPVPGAPSPGAQSPQFHAPVRVTAGVKALRVDECGHAAPAWGDIDNDGKPDLIVGQFAHAWMRAYRHVNGASFTAGKLVEAAGAIAIVPEIS